MRPKPGLGAIVVLGSAALTVIASFLPWIDRGEDVATFSGVDQTPNAWGRGLFPLMTLVAFAAVLALVDVAIAWFGSRPVAPRLGMGEVQLRLAIAIPALAMMLAFWMLDLFGSDRSIGFWLSLLGAIGMVVGAVVSRAEARVRTPLAAGYQPSAPVYGMSPPGTMPTGSGVPSGSVAPFPPPQAGGATVLFAPYWFYVEEAAPIVRTPGTGEAVAMLQPGQWYLAREQQGGWVSTALEGGGEGWIELVRVHRQA